MELFYCVLLALLIIFIIKLLTRKNEARPPGPFALPLIGHLHLIIGKELNPTLVALSNKYGPILFLKFFSRTVVVISSESLFEECFTKKNDMIFADRPCSMAREIFSYNCTSAAWSHYGDHWRHLRRIYNLEVFSPKSVQSSSTIRRDEMYRLVRDIYQTSNGGLQHFNFKFMISKLMFNIIVRTVAGSRCFEESMDMDEQKRLLAHLREAFAPTLKLHTGDFFPLLRWSGFYLKEKTLIEQRRKQDLFLQDIINKHRGRNRDSSVKATAEENEKGCLIDVLLSFQEVRPKEYTDDIIKGLIWTMMIAGTVTTINTMELTLSQLLRYPDILQKARLEIDQHTRGRLLDDVDLAKLPYLYCVINEALRLYDGPLLLPHASSEACTVAGYNVPRGTVLYTNITAIHTDPNTWVEPTKFMPERFLHLQGEQEMRFKFAPFGVGRRECPGINMGMRIVALAVGTIIQCFEWERVGGDKLNLNETDPGVAMCKPRPNMLKRLSEI